MKARRHRRKVVAVRVRSSGILLHLTSLPGPHGCRDLGAEARAFVDVLAPTGQRWWQMLPVGQIHWEMIRLAMMSVARTAIFPLQDVLGLGREARMNRPAHAGGNWRWRVDPRATTPAVEERLSAVTRTYDRNPRR